VRRIFWSKRDEVTGGSIKLRKHNEELNYLYYSPNIISRRSGFGMEREY
jgi:hypothetical protein